MGQAAIRNRITTVNDFVQANRDANSSKLAQQAEMEFRRRKLERLSKTGGGNIPAALQLANEYEKRVNAGDMEGANNLAMFAKTQEKNLFRDAEGILQERYGAGKALAGIQGNIAGAKERGKQIQQSVYEPLRQEDIAQRKANVEASTAPGIVYGKGQAALRSQMGQPFNSVEPVSEADLAAKKENALFLEKGRQSLPKEKRSMLALQDKNVFLDEKINSVRQRASGFTTGFGGALLDALPGTPAYDLKADVETLVANAGFDRLQEMRDNSPTGGALGQVSERELSLLQAAAQNLVNSQSKEQFLSNLDAFQNQRALSMQRVQEAFQQDLERFGGEAMFNPQQKQNLEITGPEAQEMYHKLKDIGYTDEDIDEYAIKMGLIR